MSGASGPPLVRLVAAAAMLACAGCGWHPVYAPASAGRGAVPAALARVDVPVIPERQGQLLRQALQARLGGGSGQVAEYSLQASYALSTEGIAITPESAVTRIRLISTATYALQALQGPPRTCLSGVARTVDAVDVQNQQYFASDLETETAERRMAEAVADQIVTRIALAFGKTGGGCEAR